MGYVRRRPYRRPRRRRNFRRRNVRGRGAVNKVPRGLMPQTYRFKRQMESIIRLSSEPVPPDWITDGDNGIYKQFAYILTELPDFADFTNLFRRYRLRGAALKMYFSNTASSAHGNEVDNTQLLVYTSLNTTGETGGDPSGGPLNDDYWLQTQAKKVRTAINGGKPLSYYTKLKQMNKVYQEGGPDTENSIFPRWVKTSAPTVSHQGLNVRIVRADGAPFTTGFSNTQTLRIVETVYCEFNGVQ